MIYFSYLSEKYQIKSRRVQSGHNCYNAFAGNLASVLFLQEFTMFYSYWLTC